MRTLTWPAAFARLDDVEVRLCRPANAIGRYLPVRGYFAAVSRLGDGVAWYLLLLALPAWYGSAAVPGSVHMGLTAIAGVAVYRFLKGRLLRERPFAAHPGVRMFTAPLDRYSFPSGHTLHAVCFTVMLAGYQPQLLWLVVPFALSVALSRVVLGLHYPSDVLAGGLIGWGLAEVSLALAVTG